MARGKLAHRLRRAISLGMDVPTLLQLFKTKIREVKRRNDVKRKTISTAIYSEHEEYGQQQRGNGGRNDSTCISQIPNDNNQSYNI